MMNDLLDWVGRIHIGRWNDRHVWQAAIEKKAKEWMVNTPCIQGNNTNVMAWQKAGLIMGLRDSVPTFIKKQLLLMLQNIAPKDINPEYLLLAYALKARIQSIEEFVMKHEEGTIPYRKTDIHIRYVDTLGMVVPYLNWAGHSKLALRQIQEYDVAMCAGLYPAHAFDMQKRLPLGVFDWGRGCGWYILSLTEASELYGNHARIVKLSDALLPMQRMDGSFGSFLFVRNSRMESSCTAIIGRLMITAFDITKDRKYFTSAKMCESALMKATRRNGSIDYCQGDTCGIGLYSRVFSLMPFAQGMALDLSKAIDKYEKISC